MESYTKFPVYLSDCNYRLRQPQLLNTIADCIIFIVNFIELEFGGGGGGVHNYYKKALKKKKILIIVKIFQLFSRLVYAT